MNTTIIVKLILGCPNRSSWREIWSHELMGESQTLQPLIHRVFVVGSFKYLLLDKILRAYESFISVTVEDIFV